MKSVLESLKSLYLSGSERPLMSYEVLQMWNTRAMALAIKATIKLKLLAKGVFGPRSCRLLVDRIYRFLRPH